MKKNELVKIVFGKLLRDLRLAAHKTQEGLALDIGVERTYISMLERGIHGPSLSTLILIAKAFHIKTYELVKEFEVQLEKTEESNARE